ncbi:hypothetical protein ACJ41O_015033 [Fusarium nematophilum]
MSSAITSLAGRIAVVTGASSGNGRAIVLALASTVASVVCSDIQPEGRQGGYENDLSIPTHELIASSGAESLFRRCDVSKASDIKPLVDIAVERFGRLDIMVNNAGIFTGPKTILEETEDHVDHPTAINTRGVYFGCKYAICQFLSQAESATTDGAHSNGQTQPSIGKIINIASIGGLAGLTKEPSYCTSKGAVVNPTRQLAIDFSPRCINVSALCPGFLATAMVRPFIEDPSLNKSLHEATA